MKFLISLFLILVSVSYSQQLTQVVKTYENGKMWSEQNLKDGIQIGLSTGWYENGQKYRELTYKDDELISEKKWNEDGSIKE